MGENWKDLRRVGHNEGLEISGECEWITGLSLNLTEDVKGEEDFGTGGIDTRDEGLRRGRKVSGAF